MVNNEVNPVRLSQENLRGGMRLGGKQRGLCGEYPFYSTSYNCIFSSRFLMW